MYNDQIVYGIHPVSELLTSRLSSIDHVYFEKDKKSSQLFELMKVCRKERLSYTQLPEPALRHFASSNHHQGVAALCSVLPYASIETIRESVAEKKNPLFIVPASIEDPGNLGAIIRSAVALGADAVFLERKHTAPLNASVAKSSAGMVEHIAIARPKNLEGVLEEFAKEGYQIIGAEMEGGKHPAEVDFKTPCILVLGGEHRGIPPYLRKLCTSIVSIPMKEKAQSLNVSVTAAILLYEAARQRC